jgi:simple sugar transport system permease protein
VNAVQIIDPLVIGVVIAKTFEMATPLVLAALGGMFSERSGVVNIALEGMMTMGAWAAVAVTWFTNNPWLGVLASVAVGGLFGLVHAIVCVNLKGNQIVSGTAIILFALGFSAYMIWVIWPGASGVTPSVTPLPRIYIPAIASIPILGLAFGSQSPLVYIMILTVPLCWYVLYRTPFGLRLRAAGEDPSTLDTAGVSVDKMRVYGVLLSGCLAGLAGAFLSIGIGSEFGKNMVGGRGFIALAALIFGNWTPVGCFLAGTFFGFLTGIQYAAQIAPQLSWMIGVNSFIQMIPFAAVIVALGIIRRSVPPKAIGVPYIKERQQ